MTKPAPISSISLHAVTVTPKTLWQFIEVRSTDGLVGVGEATMMPDRADLHDETADLASRLLGCAAHPDSIGGPLPDDKAGAAARSAVDQALWDIATRHAGIPLAEGLGRIRRASVPVYANINRRTVDRTPEGFLASAEAAIADGYTRFKVAPFDELSPELAGDALSRAMDAGLARVAAVREHVGPGAELMVDCHWRCRPETAETLIREAAGLGVYWVECPLAETVGNVPTLARLRSLANDLGMRLAGCEENIGVDGFRPFIEGGAYDVLMPDVKYAGGLSEFFRIAEAAAKAGTDISPHNPSGPISHLVSLEVCSVLPNLLSLEMQYGETPLFGALVAADIPHIADGTSARADVRAGLGAPLLLEAVPEGVVTRVWSD